MAAIEILDTRLTLLGEVTDYKSLRLKRKFSGVGDFELVLPLSHPMAARLQRDRLLMPAGEPEKTMVIEQIKKTEGTQLLSVKGYTLSGLLRRRVCVPPASGAQHFGYDRFRGDAESIMRHYVENNAIHPENAPRKIDCLALEEANGHRGMQDVPWSARFEQLDELLQSIGAYTDSGFSIVPDFKKKKLVFTFLPGRDKTTGQGRLTFGVKMGNVSGTETVENAQQEKNAALVGGAGEEENRMILSICPGEETDLNRRECFVDAGSRTTAQELREEGERRLSDKKIVQTIKADVLDTPHCRYGVNWNLGDRVIVVAYGVQMMARIMQIQESIEGGRNKVDVVFGTPAQGIERVIQDGMRRTVR